MPLQQDSVTFNFNSGVDTFVDPNQLPVGKFQYLQNCVFVQSGGQGKLQKRNGYQNLAALDSQSSYIDTYSNGLISISNRAVKSYSQVVNQWLNVTPITPLQLSTNQAIRNSFSQFGFDMAVSGGLACVAYLENQTTASSGGVNLQRYAVIDINTNQPVLVPANITSTVGTTSQTSISRVFSIGSQFAIFTGIPQANVSSGSYGALQYFTINQNTLAVSAPNIFNRMYSTQTVGTVSMNNSFDGVVASNTLYLSWYAGSASGNSGIMATSFSNNMVQGAVASVTQSNGAISCLSLSADNVGPSPSRLWNTYVSVAGSGSGVYNCGTAVTDFNLGLISSVTFFNTNGFSANAYRGVVSYAVNGTMTFFLNTTRTWTGTNLRDDGYGKGSSGLNFVDNTISGLIRGPSGLAAASKPVVIGSDSYLLTTLCNSLYQSTYFLINSASSIISKLSYGNGGGNPLTDAPQINSIGSSLFVGYLNKETIANVNKTPMNVSSQTQVAGVYGQTGINYAKFNFTTNYLNSIETANNLHINGGQLYHYDGVTLDELNFNVYPDFVVASGSFVVGRMTPQTYFYAATFEYTDNKGNVFRSAPSIPVSSPLGSGQSSIQIIVPTCRLTLKQPVLVNVSIYRWSTGQQTFYRVTSQTNLDLSNLVSPPNTVNTFLYQDVSSDGDILGNPVLYTTGGVVEDDGPPASNALTMFDDRMWTIDAEDPNLLWFSKTILEGTSVEFSQLLTYYVPPTTATGAPTGPVRSFAPMDDKLILFKEQTIYYISGSGPDNTGANNQYSSSPIFIASGVGCSNQNSIVLTPQGLMFQSGAKGIWLLKRDLSVDYVGKDVIQYEGANVVSGCLIPNTNHVKLTLDSGITLLYDYLVGQWGVDTLNGKSATIYNGLHTFLNNTGSIFQELPNSYVDGTVPVVMQFQTGFLNPTGLQGYQRAYRAYLLGNYISGQTYTLGIAYDYNPAIAQIETVAPTNTLGSGSQVEQWQINFKNTQCQSFQLTFNEISSGVAGAGLSLSGVDLVVGRKKTFPRNLGAKNRI